MDSASLGHQTLRIRLCLSLTRQSLSIGGHSDITQSSRRQFIQPIGRGRCVLCGPKCDEALFRRVARWTFWESGDPKRGLVRVSPNCSPTLHVCSTSLPTASAMAPQPKPTTNRTVMPLPTKKLVKTTKKYRDC